MGELRVTFCPLTFYYSLDIQIIFFFQILLLGTFPFKDISNVYVLVSPGNETSHHFRNLHMHKWILQPVRRSAKSAVRSCNRTSFIPSIRRIRPRDVVEVWWKPVVYHLPHRARFTPGAEIYRSYSCLFKCISPFCLGKLNSHVTTHSVFSRFSWKVKHFTLSKQLIYDGWVSVFALLGLAALFNISWVK